MDKSWRNISIALAGVVQAVSLVEQLAKTGYLKTEVFETAINSLLQQQPSSVEAVYGNLINLEEGFKLLEELLNNHRDPKNADLLRYLIGIFHIQKKLSKRRDVLYIIGTRLEKVDAQIEHFGSTHDNVVSNLADIYTDTISKFQYRIQVTGELSYLQQQRVANQIRALLLAAIRSATLWRQVGGSRWHFLFYRSSITEMTSRLLKENRVER